MELLFESTEAFERDLARLPEDRRYRLIEAINLACPLLACDEHGFFSKVYQPRAVRLNHGCCSSLYVMPVDEEDTILLTIDDDPIFGQIIITLLRVVQRADIETAYIQTARALYRHRLQDIEGPHG